MPRVLPRPPTAPSRPAPIADSRLPDDLLDDQARRFTAFALVSGGLWAIGLVMDRVVMPRFSGMQPPRAALVIQASAIVFAIALYAWVRFSPAASREKTDAGLWLMLLNAAGIALLETWAIEPTTAMVGHVSWTAIAILLSAMIVPSTPGKMLAASLVAASLGPIGVWLAHLRGVDVPSAGATFLMYMPSYSCALAAVVPARMLQRLGSRLREARELGSYELEARLGEGGMGEVWRARHRFLARPAAIKLVRPEALGAGSASRARVARQRFEAEAQVTASLTSPHTVRLFDFGVADDGRFYYVMELLDGLDLAAIVARFGPLPVPRVLWIVRQVCHSLAEAHARGLVHRDVKPANIFLCRAGLDADVVKVLDFGLVHAATGDPGRDLTLSADGVAGLVGTPAFMAPEMIRGGDVDARADLYALGCVMHVLLTGQPVFAGTTTMQILLDHAGAAPEAPSARASQPVPAWLDALVLSCLEKDPARRPASASQVLARVVMHDESRQWTNDDARRWWQSQAGEIAHAAADARGDEDTRLAGG
jgi:hypothetical protein